MTVSRYCQSQVYGRESWESSHQCTRKATIDGQWCGQHSPQAKQERWAKSKARYARETAPMKRRQAIIKAAEALIAGREVAMMEWEADVDLSRLRDAINWDGMGEAPDA